MTNTENTMTTIMHFFWSVTWRTVILAFIAAVFVGIGLAYLQIHEGMSAEHRQYFTSVSGIPVTFMTLTYVGIRQAMRFKAGI